MNEVFPWREAPKADFAVIGYPIHHSLSPKMHAAAFEAAGLSASYVATEVPPGEVGSALDHLRSLGYRGVNVTVPHKEDAFRWCESTTDVSTRLRVCNTIDLERRHGTSTDGQGFAASLADIELDGKQAVVLGAGGSTRSILEALLKDGWHVSLWNRTKSKAEALILDFGFDVTLLDEPNLLGANLIVNTTSASLSGERLPLDWDEVLTPADALAYDLAYGAGLTTFLKDAQSWGIQTMDGRKMLMEQGAAAFEFWWGLPAPREAMLAALQ